MMSGDVRLHMLAEQTPRKESGPIGNAESDTSVAYTLTDADRKSEYHEKEYHRTETMSSRTNPPKVTRNNTDIYNDEDFAGEEMIIPTHNDSLYQSLLIFPNTPFRIGWDLLVLVCLLYICLVVPIHLSFQPGGSVWNIFDFILDIVFICDVFINFFSAFYMDDGKLVIDFPTIAYHYLTGWFCLDFFTSIPFGWFIGAGWLADAKYAKALRIFKLVKMVRVSKAARIVQKVQERFELKNSVVQMLKFSIIIVCMAHWLGCFFFAIAASNNFEDSWVNNYAMRCGGNLCKLQDQDIKTQYIVAFYWALTTMTTIGYGDIIPGSNAERIFVMIAMVIGALVFAYGLTNMCTLVFNFNKGQVAFNAKTDDLRDILEAKNIPQWLKKRVNTFMFYSYFMSNTDKLKDTDVLGYLSPALRTEVQMEIVHNQFRGVVFLHQYGIIFLRHICDMIHPTIYPPGELIVLYGSRINQVFFVGGGSVHYYQDVSIADPGDVDLVWETLDSPSSSAQNLLERDEKHFSSIAEDNKRKSAVSVISRHKKKEIQRAVMRKKIQATNQSPTKQMKSDTTEAHNPYPHIDLGMLRAKEWTLSEGCTVGEYTAMAHEQADFSLFAASHCDIYTMSASDYSNQLMRVFSLATVETLNRELQKRVMDLGFDFTCPIGKDTEKVGISAESMLRTAVNVVHAEVHDTMETIRPIMVADMIPMLKDASNNSNPFIKCEYVTITQSFRVRELRRAMHVQRHGVSYYDSVRQKCKHITCRRHDFCLFTAEPSADESPTESSIPGNNPTDGLSMATSGIRQRVSPKLNHNSQLGYIQSFSQHGGLAAVTDRVPKSTSVPFKKPKPKLSPVIVPIPQKRLNFGEESKSAATVQEAIRMLEGVRSQLESQQNSGDKGVLLALLKADGLVTDLQKLEGMLPPDAQAPQSQAVDNSPLPATSSSPVTTTASEEE